MVKVGMLGLIAILRRPTNTEIQSSHGVGEKLGAKGKVAWTLQTTRVHNEPQDQDGVESGG